MHWQREAENAAVEAELWSSTVQQAAPRAVGARARAAAAGADARAAAAASPASAAPGREAARARAGAEGADIALEREKKLKEQKERERELEQQAQQQKKLEAAKKAAQEKKEAEARERAEDEAERKKEEQQKLAEQKKQPGGRGQAGRSRQEEGSRRQAGSAGGCRSRGDAQAHAGAWRVRAAKVTGTPKSSGPSGSYGGKVAAAVRPNVVFPDADLVSGNPGAEFDVRLAPDGTIVGTPTLRQVQRPARTGTKPRCARCRRPRSCRATSTARFRPRLIVTLRPKR